VPYGEANAFMKGFHSAYYNESHIKFRKDFRKFINENITPYADEWEENGKAPID